MTSSWSHRSSCHISLVCMSRRDQACNAPRGRDWRWYETKGQRSTIGSHAASFDCMGSIEDNTTSHLPASTAYQQTRSSIDTSASGGHPTGMSTETQSPQHGGTPNDPCHASMLNIILLARSVNKRWNRSIALSSALNAKGLACPVPGIANLECTARAQGKSPRSRLCLCTHRDQHGLCLVW